MTQAHFLETTSKALNPNILLSADLKSLGWTQARQDTPSSYTINNPRQIGYSFLPPEFGDIASVSADHEAYPFYDDATGPNRFFLLNMESPSSPGRVFERVKLSARKSYFDVEATVVGTKPDGSKLDLSDNMLVTQVETFPWGENITHSAKPRSKTRFPLTYSDNIGASRYSDYFVYMPFAELGISDEGLSGTLLQIPRIPFEPIIDGGNSDMNRLAVISYPIDSRGQIAIFRNTSNLNQTIIYGADHAVEQAVIGSIVQHVNAAQN